VAAAPAGNRGEGTLVARSRRTTLLDVAKQAGVSRTTASYILNDRTEQMRISEETAARVRAVMDELEYRPNRNAQNLRRAQTKTIGVISDFVASGAFSSQLLRGANTAARRHDHLLMIGETLGDPALETLLVEELLDRQVDGIIYLTVSASTVHLPDRLRDRPTVLLNCVDPNLDVPAILPDDEAGGRAAAEHLLGAGLRRDVWVVGDAGDDSAPAGQNRIRGIRQAFRDADADLAGIIECSWDVQPARAALATWLDARHVPSALICLNDRVSLGVYQALAARGLAIPRDVSVISFDGSDLASWLDPQVSSLALPLTAMGDMAVEVLLNADHHAVGPLMLPLLLQRGGSVIGEDS
jgi:LacI family transcriptional regulator